MSGLGWRYRLRGVYLNLSYALGLPVRCFGRNGHHPTAPCPDRAWVQWDPIVGAYCQSCIAVLLGEGR